MAKPVNNNKAWTPQDDQLLKQLLMQNTPTRVAGIKLKRTPEAVQNRANKLGMSTKPTNQSPYNRRKK